MADINFRINKATGRVVEHGRHVPLRGDKGVWVKAVDQLLTQRLEAQLQQKREEIFRAHAAKLGIEPSEMTADQRLAAVAAVADVDDELYDNLAAAFVDCVADWDEGFAIDDDTGEPMKATDPVGQEGQTALEYWADYVVRRDHFALFKVMGAAGEYSRQLVGNSQPGPAGTSSTGQEDPTAPSPSTAHDSASSEDPTALEASADTEEVPAVPV